MTSCAWVVARAATQVVAGGSHVRLIADCLIAECLIAECLIAVAVMRAAGVAAMAVVVGVERR